MKMALSRNKTLFIEKEKAFKLVEKFIVSYALRSISSVWFSTSTARFGSINVKFKDTGDIVTRPMGSSLLLFMLLVQGNDSRFELVDQSEEVEYVHETVCVGNRKQKFDDLLLLGARSGDIIRLSSPSGLFVLKRQ